MSQLQVTGEAKIRDIQGPVVANNGVVTALDGAASQYVRGDGTLADFPTSTGGGSSVSYYLNSSVSQGTIGGVAYRELSKNPIIGAGTDIAISANGYIASYITDANDPDLLEVPGGNFNCEFYFSVDSDNQNPYVYAELYKYDGTTFTLLGSSQAIPEYLSSGTTLAPYYFAIPVATATLALTDRIAIRIYVNVDGRTVTLHTEDNHLCQVVTTFSKGMTSLNNLTKQNQYLTVGTSGTDFNIVSSNDTHTFNIPSASASNRGLITTGTQTIAGAKTFSSVITGDAGISLKEGVVPSGVGYTGLAGDADGLLITKRIGTTAYTNLFYFQAIDASNTYTFPNLTGTLALLEGTQTFTGDKTFNGGVDFNNALNINNTFNLRNNLVGSTLYTNFSILKSGSLQTLTYLFSTANSSKLVFNDAANYTYTFPTTSGTLALTSNLSSYVPYTGATTNVDLGTNEITARNFIAENSISAKHLTSGLAYRNGYTTLSANADSFVFAQAISAGNLKTAIFDTSNLINNTSYTYTLPAASGSLALLESTQTFTGNKTFNQVSFDNSPTFLTNSVAYFMGNAYLNKGIAFSDTGTPAIFSDAQGFTINRSGTTSTMIIRRDIGASSYYQTLTFTNNAANRTYTFPDATGTIALTSNLSSYVPYTGATAAVNLGSNALTALTLYSNAGLGLSNSGQFTGGGGYTGINGRTDGIDIRPNNGGIFQFIFSNTTNRTYTLPDATGTIVLGTGTTNYLPKFTGASTIGNSLIFDNGTSVGVGTATPFGTFNVVAGTNKSLIIQDSGIADTIEIASYSTSGGTRAIAMNGSVLTFGTGTAGGGSATPRLTINATGNLGIGTNSPVGKLDINAGGNTNIVISNDSVDTGYNIISLNGTRTKGSYAGIAGGGTGDNNLYLNSGNDVVVQTGASYSARMRITSTGNVGIGTSSPSEPLSVSFAAHGLISQHRQSNGVGVGQNFFMKFNDASGSAVNYAGIYADIQANTTGAHSGRMILQVANAGSLLSAITIASEGWVTFQGNGFGFTIGQAANVNRLDYNGSTFRCLNSGNSFTPIAASAFNVNSDYRLKEDLKEFNNSIDILNSIKIYDFKWKDREERNYGVIAHEMQEVLPYIVYGEKDGMESNGEIKTQGVDYSKLVPVLVKAIQELSAKVTALENK